MNKQHDLLFDDCKEQWLKHGYVNLSLLSQLSSLETLKGSFQECFRHNFISFNCTDLSIKSVGMPNNDNVMEKLAIKQYSSDTNCCKVGYSQISSDTFKQAYDYLKKYPNDYLGDHLDRYGYPFYSPGKTYAYNSSWVRRILCESEKLFEKFKRTRRSDIAILVGNGPSLNKINFDLFKGQDVYISNYAIKNKVLSKYARGVAVTNYLVAEQEPYWFSINQLWKFYPLWLACSIPVTQNSILLHAIGGKLFYSTDVTSIVAWHSTVSYFWLQILYSAGYKKIILTGFDHFYNQSIHAKEGDLIHQVDNDNNHFDVNYFKGKKWQAADVSKMEETYLLAKHYFEKDGREIVNATVGGHLEVFRRSDLSNELPSPSYYGRLPRKNGNPSIIIVTPFWRGDVDLAELQWRLINRLGMPFSEHLHLFKHGIKLLPFTTFPRVVCADIEGMYPELANLPHPSGPNLMFKYTVEMLLDTHYTHFFWLEPDCIPTDANWLNPFVNKLKEYPDAPVVGTGGGTIAPGRLHWRNHFAGCSLYSLQALSQIDWAEFLENNLDVSFDAWLSVNLNYIRLNGVNNDDTSSTIIYGGNRYDWSQLSRPKSLVYGMFEHWRPDKIMTKEELESRLYWPGFSLYHAVKDLKIIERLYQKISKSASVIIINYNNECYLSKAITSAIDQVQDFENYEVIVVDDGSSDSSVSIIKSFGDRIKPIFLSHGLLNSNFNQQRALKSGLSEALGDIIFLMDGDDIFYPNKVSEVCNYFDDPAVVLVQHALDMIDDYGKKLNKVFKAFPDSKLDYDLYYKSNKVNYYQPTSALAFRRSYLKSQLVHLNVDEHVNTWLDVRLTRFAPLFGKVIGLNDRLGAWRRHMNSDSIRTDNILERVESHERWFDETSIQNGYPLVHFSWKDKSCIVGPYSRDDHAHWDETICVRYLTSHIVNGTMIDVGAHEGYALMPFLNGGWNIIGFEPDDKNRSVLLSRIENHKYFNRIKLDSRCVSSKSESNASFFSSNVSTGISGLSAFHESHVEVKKVDVISLVDYFSSHEVPSIDFLKIDTEGHDLFVLQGYPWEISKPSVIECEFEDFKTVPLGYNFHDLSNFLVNKGYTVYVSEWHPIIRYGLRHDWNRLVRYPCSLSHPEGWGNLLAFRDPIDENILADTVKKVLKVEGSHNASKLTMSCKSKTRCSNEKNFISTFHISPSKYFSEIGDNQWEYRHGNSKQRLWIASMVSPGLTSGRSFVGFMRLNSDSIVTVDVSIGRHGSSEYEGYSERVTLMPGRDTVIKIQNKFVADHVALKLQVDVIDLPLGDKALFCIDSFCIVESVMSISSRIGISNMTFKAANNFFRAGDIATALVLYIWLYRKSPLKIYINNALFSARRLGLKWVKCEEDLNMLLA